MFAVGVFFPMNRSESALLASLKYPPEYYIACDRNFAWALKSFVNVFFLISFYSLVRLGFIAENAVRHTYASYMSLALKLVLFKRVSEIRIYF